MRQLWHVEPINWIRSVRNFLTNEAKKYIMIHMFNYKFRSSHVKIDVCPGDDLQTIYPSGADG